MINEPVKLTQFSHGGGCGCKISPKVLQEILAGSLSVPDKNLLVGNSSSDDAAVYLIGNGKALISTTDFFMPIVDDPFDFGRIASANAISDVYAMGGQPVVAIAILGWPVEKIPASVAQQVIEGARSICSEAGITLAGGHSIDSPEPFFGLAVNGLIEEDHIKKNNSAEDGDYIFLTKPIGVGILTTAGKRNKLLPEHAGIATNQMVQLNKIGELLGRHHAVTAMTDITGFGLAGHLAEVADGSNLSARIEWMRVPLITDMSFYIQEKIFPDATKRNWSSYGTRISIEKDVPASDAFTLLADPQTNGGLLFTVKENGLQDIKQLLTENGYGKYIEPIGRMEGRSGNSVYVV